MRLILALVLALPLAAQESRFDVRSRLVLVPVTVTDAKGRPVDGLEAADFLLSDDRRPRKITVDTIATGVAPIALVIAVQASGISTPVLEKVRKIGAMIQPVVTGERGCAAVVAFAETVDWLQDCTKDPDALQRALRRLQPGEHQKAIMLDAVMESIERLRRQPSSRRVLFLVSETRDRGSKARLQAAVAAAQAADVTVYAATYVAMATAFTSKSPLTVPKQEKDPQTTPESEGMGTANGAPPSKYNPMDPGLLGPGRALDPIAGVVELLHMSGPNVTLELAAGTGGTSYAFTRQKGFEDAIQKLGKELHSQYVLSFAPEDAAPGYHTLEVKVTRGRPFHIRARPGYWAGGL